MSEYIVIGTIVAAFPIAAVLSYFFTSTAGQRTLHAQGRRDRRCQGCTPHAKKPIPRLGGHTIYGGFLCSILIFGQQ